MAPEPRERQRRRKIPLACEPCRERKSRCDGGKPICSSCQRRSLGLEQCVYKLENARTASSDVYIKVLHDRIRQLEQACTTRGIEVPPANAESLTQPDGSPSESHRLAARSSQQSMARSTVAFHLASSHSPEHIDASDTASAVTAMGTMLTEDDVDGTLSASQDFYGGSSTASFLKEACDSMKPHGDGDSTHKDVASASANKAAPRNSIPSPASRDSFDYSRTGKFTLPPRSLADHLLERYWERVFYLYPFFHQPAFEHAYQSLWQSNTQATEVLPFSDLGLGASPGAEANSIVFHCALNAILALGCHFSDLQPADKVAAAHTFFIRAKSLVGLDFLDMNNLGVVQALLILSLVLQSTPFPSRCWNAVGVACRVAQGLGLHAEPGQDPRNTLEREIRRRTWYGCVIMDTLVSMTFGRPMMTTQISILPLPSVLEDVTAISSQDTLSPHKQIPSRLCFYVESIRLCKILEEILSKVYQPSLNRSANDPPSGDSAKNYHSLDTVIGLHAQLSEWERSVSPFLSWNVTGALSDIPADKKQVLEIQKKVLHARFIYVRLLLHRPMLTLLSSRKDSITGDLACNSKSIRSDALVDNTLYFSFTAECARSCVEAAMELLQLIHASYQTAATGSWWWNGLYACTAGLVLIVARLCPSLWSSLDHARLQTSWTHCQEILGHLASFSVSALKSLALLKKIHENVFSVRSGDQSNQDSSAQPGILSRMDSVLEYPPSVEINADLDILNNLEAQAFGDVDMMGFFFNWDQSLDFISNGPQMALHTFES